MVLWTELERLVRPHYPKGVNGRPPVGLSVMLRIYFLQQWFNLSDPGAEDALYESAWLCRFAGSISTPQTKTCLRGSRLGPCFGPDETTILNFRHLLEAHELGGAMLDVVNHYLEAQGLRITTGTIVDATIIRAPSSTKNASGESDPEMHETGKGNQWCVSRTRAQARDAVLKMGAGLPEPAYRSGLQTASCCCVEKAWW